tara:strand:- start:5302 stop:6684 length:1383 start_codon:yes stop_codon:yes gene_type:complete
MAGTGDGEFAPSTCEVLNAVVTSHSGKKVDIAQMVTKFEIVQSMNTNSYSGNITVQDTIGILEDFPLRSEEKLDLKLKGYDLNTEVNLKTHVYKIDNIQASESSSTVIYNMNFVSNITYNASKRKIIKAYSSSVSGIAKMIFDSYFAKLGETDYLDANDRSRTLEYATARHIITEEQDRSFFVQPTENMTRCVIPNMIPTEAMHFLYTQAYNSQTPSNSHKFFETLKDFYFATDEYFIQTARRSDLIHLFYSPAASVDGTRPSDQVNRVEELQILNKGLDTASDIFSGAYRNRVTQINLVRRELTVHDWDYSVNANYIDMSGNLRNLEDNPHTAQFREDTFTDENARDFLVFQDYQQPGDIPSSLHTNRFMPQIISNRVSYEAHLNATKINCIMKGRIDIMPGMIVNLDVQTLNGISNIARNATLSGRYLVQGTRHVRDDEGVLNAALTLVKFDWSKGEV